jgi:type VI secretion system protein ImpK
MRLSDCFSEVIAYINYALHGSAQSQITFEQLKQKTDALLAESEKCAAQCTGSREDYDLARFAICAWVDETVLSSDWDGRRQWQGEQLQRRYYNTTEAGIEFYNRLNAIGLHQSDVREIYYMCLAMGFKGRYCNDNDAILVDQLKDSNLKLLLGSSVGLPNLDKMEFFPDAYPAGTDVLYQQEKKGLFSLFNLSFFLAPLLLLGILFVIYHFILGNIVELYLIP